MRIEHKIDDLINSFKKRKKVRVLIANSKSKNFMNRVKIEEQFLKDIRESRIFHEIKSTIANLRDIKNRFNGNCNLEVSEYNKKPAYSIATFDDKKIAFRRYGFKKGEYGQANISFIFDKNDKEFKKAKKIFEKYWNSAKPIKL